MIQQWHTLAGYLQRKEIVAVLLFVAAYLCLTFFKWGFIKIANSLAQKATVIGLLKQSAQKFSFFTILVISLYVAFTHLPFFEKWQVVVRGIVLFIVTVQVLIIANTWIRFAFSDDGFLGRSRPQLRTMRNSISSVLIIFTWVLGFLLVLDNLGFNVATIIAGLGVGGIAVGLALQSLLSDLIASFSIGFDQPFEVGDFIVLENCKGTVEKVGLKTTRIRSLGGELLVLPNSKVVNSYIQNYKKMQERRIVFTLGVTYDTGASELAELPGLIKNVILSIDKTRFDRAHFLSFGDSALNYEIVYFVLDPDYNTYMDIQQNINLQLCAAFRQKGISFAFPTRTIDFNGEQLASVFKKQSQQLTPN